MSTERTTFYVPRHQSSHRAIISGSARPRGQSVSGRVQSTNMIQLRSRLATRDAGSPRAASPLNIKGSSAERPLTGDFHKRSRTISPTRRSNYAQRDTSTTNKGLSGNIKDTRNTTTGNKQNLKVKQNRNKIGSDQNETKTTAKENRCIALIDEVSAKILETNDRLNAADVKVVVERLREKLMKGVKNGNETEPSKLYREDSSYRIIKNEHQHEKVMLNCGMKKQKNKLSDKYSKTNVNTKSRYDSDYITFSGNTDNWTGVSGDKKGNVSGNVSPKVSKKSSVNKNKICEKNTSKPKTPAENKNVDYEPDFENKIETVENVLSVEDYNAWKKLPEAVDQLMDYIDGITKEQKPEPQSVKDNKPPKAVKKLVIMNERKEKIKLWDRERRLMTLEAKTEDNSLERKDDVAEPSVDGNCAIDICNEETSPGLYHKDHDSKSNMYIPKNKGPNYEGLSSGGDIKPPRQHLSTQDMSIRVQRCKKSKRPTTAQQWNSFFSKYN